MSCVQSCVMTESELGTALMHLRDAGERRAHANRHTRDGIEQLTHAYSDIRVWAAEARRLGATVKSVYETVGISRTALDNILNNKTGAKTAPHVAPEAVDVAQQLRTLAEWIRDPSDDTRPPAETAEALDAAVRLLVTQ